MKKILLFLVVVILFCSCKPPASLKPSVIGGQKYDSARAIIITKDSFVLAGMTQSLGLGGVDAYFLQTDKNGRLKTQNTYGGKGDDRGLAIVPDADKGYLIAGYTTSYGAGNADVYLVKTDAKGVYISAKIFGGAGFDSAKAICSDKAGGYILAGDSNSFGKGDYDAYIIRVDSEGNCVWAKTFGGAGNEIINSVAAAGNGKFIAVGSSNSKSRRLHDWYALVFDLNGNLVSENYYGGEYADIAHSVIMTSDGNYLIAGEMGTKHTVTDIVLIKTDIKGKIIREKAFGGVMADYPAQVIETKDKGFAVAGVTESQGSGMSDVIIIKTDKDGNELWEKVFGGKEDEYAGGIAEDNDGGLVFAGWTKSYGSGDYDIYLLKTDKDGMIKN